MLKKREVNSRLKKGNIGKPRGKGTKTMFVPATKKGVAQKHRSFQEKKRV